SVNVSPQVVSDPSGWPIVAWEGTTAFLPAPQIFVRRWNGTDVWEEIDFHSATEQGISAAAFEAHAPALGLILAPGRLRLVWLDAPEGDASSSLFLRQSVSGPTFTLTINVSGDGAVTSNSAGVDCQRDSCGISFPAGTSVSVLHAAGLEGVF